MGAERGRPAVREGTGRRAVAVDLKGKLRPVELQIAFDEREQAARPRSIEQPLRSVEQRLRIVHARNDKLNRRAPARSR